MRGWVSITATTDEPERRFAVGQRVLLDDQLLTVREVRFAPRLTVLLDGCADRDGAEALRGRWLYVEADESDDPDAYYDHQLEGLAVVLDEQVIGSVVEVLHLPGQDVLAVDLDGRQVLVPFVEQIVPVVDLDGRRIEVRRVEGLFDAD